MEEGENARPRSYRCNTTEILGALVSDTLAPIAERHAAKDLAAAASVLADAVETLAREIPVKYSTRARSRSSRLSPRSRQSGLAQMWPDRGSRSGWATAPNRRRHRRDAGPVTPRGPPRARRRTPSHGRPYGHSAAHALRQSRTACGRRAHPSLLPIARPHPDRRLPPPPGAEQRDRSGRPVDEGRRLQGGQECTDLFLGHASQDGTRRALSPPELVSGGRAHGTAPLATRPPSASGRPSARITAGEEAFPPLRLAQPQGPARRWSTVAPRQRANLRPELAERLAQPGRSSDAR